MRFEGLLNFASIILNGNYLFSLCLNCKYFLVPDVLVTLKITSMSYSMIKSHTYSFKLAGTWLLVTDV
jgi:hypothetical protein